MNQIRLGDLLVRANVATEAQVAAALHEQRQWGGRLGSILVRMGILTEELLVMALSRQLNMPRAVLGPTDPIHVPPALLERLDRATCERLVVVPVGYVAERRAVQFAITDPSSIVTLDDVGRRLGLRIETLIAGETQVHQAIARLYVGDTGLDASVGGEGLQLMDNSGTAREPVGLPTSPSRPPMAAPFAGFAGPSGQTGTFTAGNTGTFLANPPPPAAGWTGASGATGTFAAPASTAVTAPPGPSPFASPPFAAPGGTTGVFVVPPAVTEEHRQVALQQHRALRALVALLVERGVVSAADLQAWLR
jgi:hypothetical protein